MSQFVMFGKYTVEAVKGISADRTKKAVKVIEGLGGKVNGMYVLLGCQDLLLLVELPGIEEAVKASLALTKMSGIGFTTASAVKVEEFDKMVA